MSPSVDQLSAGILACGCLTPFGDADATTLALLNARIALRLQPVLGREGGDAVPLALMGALDETLPPRWLPEVKRLAAEIPAEEWGTPRYPVIVTSSNFGVGSMYAYTRDHDARHLAHGPPFATVALLQRELGWGGQV